MRFRAIVFDAYGTLYDVQSVAAVTEAAFPGFGETITQIWRQKQLEYTWLRSLMGRYASFEDVTRESLSYTLENLGLVSDDAIFARIMDKYRYLDPYPDALATLKELKDKATLAILSNGSTDILNALVANTGLAPILDATISIDACRVFKPSPQTYTLIEETLGVAPRDTLFVSSNGFDVSGAKAFGLNVAWIERITAVKLAQEFRNGTTGPLTMFKALRMRSEHMGFEPDYRIGALSDLTKLVQKKP